jgi:glycosyltransferase involved in cell wall biosynthesis
MVDDLFKRVRQSPVGNRVIFTGYIDESDLASLYSSCRVFVYPSIYEGFGLPPLEAMAAGAPVIASRIPSIEEVLGSAAYLVEPTAEGIRTALVELLDDPELRAGLIKAGKERVAKFSWRETASRAREVYLEAVDRFGVKKRGCIN